MMKEDRKKNDLTPPVKLGQKVELEITDLAYGGNGVAKYENFTVFVPLGLPGQKITASITEVKKNYAMANMNKILAESPHFIKPVCPLFSVCGGCQWLHMDYAGQIKYKKKFIDYALKTHSGVDNPNLLEAIGYTEPLYYRERAQYKPGMDKGVPVLGFYRANSHDVVKVSECFILNKKINEAAAIISSVLEKEKKKVTVYDENTGSGYLRHVAIRVNSKNEALVTFVVTENIARDYITEAAEELNKNISGLKGVVLNINKNKGNRVFGDAEKTVWGENSLYEEFNGIKFVLESDTFFQINTGMLKHMAAFVEKHVSKGAKVLDLYGGTGALSLPLFNKASEITVVEINPRSIEQFNKVVQDNGITNASAVAGDAEKEASAIIKEKKPNVIILDPPRKGVHADVLKSIIENNTPEIIYISCNPMTFARDAKELKGHYELVETVPVDLFPQTYHVETMGYFKRIKP